MCDDDVLRDYFDVDSFIHSPFLRKHARQTAGLFSDRDWDLDVAYAETALDEILWCEGPPLAPAAPKVEKVW